MKKLYFKLGLGLSIFLSPMVAIAQDSVEVLFLGKSLTYTNDIPKLIDELAQSNNLQLNYSSHLPSGWTLFPHHLQSPVSTSLIRSKKWDFVVLQGQSQEFIYENEFTTFKGVRRLVTMMQENCSRPAFYSTAAPQTLRKGLQQFIHKQYSLIGNEVDGLIVPVGLAFQLAMDNGIQVHLDKVHPNVKGSYLAACTFYACFFQKSPIGLSFLGGLTASEALELQNIADQIVMGNFKNLNIYSNDTLCSEDIGLLNLVKENLVSLDVFPNPIENNFTIQLKETRAYSSKISLYSNLGKKMFEADFEIKPGVNSFSSEVDLPAGIYFLIIHNNGKMVRAKKIIIQ